MTVQKVLSSTAYIRNALAMVIAVFIWAGCSPGVPEISIEGQNAQISPMIVGSGSVFMMIKNTGSGDDALLRAQTSMDNAIVELHEVQEGKMARTDRIPIPAKSVVVLRPASFHLMIFKMPKTVREGDPFTLTLSFEKSGTISVPMQFTINATSQRKARYH